MTFIPTEESPGTPSKQSLIVFVIPNPDQSPGAEPFIPASYAVQTLENVLAEDGAPRVTGVYRNNGHLVIVTQLGEFTSEAEIPLPMPPTVYVRETVVDEDNNLVVTDQDGEDSTYDLADGFELPPAEDDEVLQYENGWTADKIRHDNLGNGCVQNNNIVDGQVFLVKLGQDVASVFSQIQTDLGYLRELTSDLTYTEGRWGAVESPYGVLVISRGAAWPAVGASYSPKVDAPANGFGQLNRQAFFRIPLAADASHYRFVKTRADGFSSYVLSSHCVRLTSNTTEQIWYFENLDLLRTTSISLETDQDVEQTEYNGILSPAAVYNALKTVIPSATFNDSNHTISFG